MWRALCIASASGAFAKPGLRRVLWLAGGINALQWVAFAVIFTVAQLWGGGLSAAAGGSPLGGGGPSPAVLRARAAAAASAMTMDAEMVLWAFFETVTKGTSLFLCTYIGYVFDAEDARFSRAVLDFDEGVEDAADGAATAEPPFERSELRDADPLLPLDPIFNTTADDAARQRLIASFDLDVTEPEWALGYRFDITLRGPAATPFEDGDHH
jgi:hypothetical protein